MSITDLMGSMFQFVAVMAAVPVGMLGLAALALMATVRS
jgi:hypothetical protein